jgi:hypothetical protein
MRLLPLLLAFFLAACSLCTNDGTVTQTGNIAPHTDIALVVMQEQMPCDLQLGGQIRWYDSPLGEIESITACFQPAMGCAEPWGCVFTVWVSNRHPPSGPDILPVWRTALVNEIGYWVWNSCYGYIGEYWVDGREVLDPGLAAWIQNVNAETQRRAQPAP